MDNFESLEQKIIFYKLTKDEQGNQIDFVIDHDLIILKKTHINKSCRPVSSHRKLLGSALVFFRRVSRRLLRWYIDPICVQQTEFNTSTMNLLEKNLNQHEEVKNEIQAKINELKNVQSVLCNQIEEINKKLEKLNIFVPNISLNKVQIQDEI